MRPFLEKLLLFLFFLSSKSFAKLNLNNASYEELLSIGLTKKQSNNLLIHRQKCRNLVSKYELQVIPDFDQQTINKILPLIFIEEYWPKDNISFITNKKLNIWNQRFGRVLFRYGRNIELSRWYTDGIFIGSPDDLKFRINFAHPDGYKFAFAFKKKMQSSFILDILVFIYKLKINCF